MTARRTFQERLTRLGKLGIDRPETHRFVRLANVIEALRLRLLADELEDDPRHARGRRTTGTRRFAGGERRDDASGLPPLLVPPPEALEAVLPGTVWDVSLELSRTLTAARAAGRTRLMIAIDLSSCLYSERLEEALRSARGMWEDDVAMLRLRAGDRLRKAYLRELQLGDTRLELTSLPLVLLFGVVPAGLRFQALALDPLGPSRDHRRLRALLGGVPQLAPGAEQEVLRIWQGGRLIELDRGRDFFQAWEIRGV
jgi:hypothetical protein